jgi:hypothetical protein
MLRSNWSKGSASLFGAHVIRQRIGRAAPAKSVKVHEFMSHDARKALCTWLEARADR